jgi:oligoribonuclease NrnB/cAMP/cGMP phosphodiesterase (DHH superfamily)
MINHNSIDLVLYHANCTDGMGAAWAAWKLLGNKAEYIPCYHGNSPPDVSGRNVAIVDFSFSNEVTKQMIAAANSLIILDHHKSALFELHDIQNAVFDMNRSGAILSWNFFHPGKEAPKFMNYIEDADLWKWELPYSKEFTAAFSMIPFDFEEFEKFEDDSVFDDAIKRGSYILAYSKTVIKKMADLASRKKLLGLDALVVNSSHFMSEIGARLSSECDVAVIWYLDHQQNKLKVSLRSFHDHVDSSEIAKNFGGGGHKKAAGFTLDSNINIETIFENVEG